MGTQKLDFLLSDLYYIAREKSNRDWMLIARAELAKAVASSDAAQAPLTDDERNRVTLDRRDLWDSVRCAIHAALNDKIPKDCVVSWAWEEATNRTMDIFQKIVDSASVAPAAASPSDAADYREGTEHSQVLADLSAGEFKPVFPELQAAQPDERAAFEAWVTTVWRPDDGAELLRKEFPRMAWAAWQARATAPQATPKTMAEVFDALEQIKTDPVLLEHLRAAATRATRTPIYQIGSPVAGGIAWWDVTQERYEAEKKAGYMKTCIVYREGE